MAAGCEICGRSLGGPPETRCECPENKPLCRCGHDYADHLPSDEGCWKCGCEQYERDDAVVLDGQEALDV